MAGRWDGFEIELDLSPRPRSIARPGRCAVTVSQVDPLDSRLRRRTVAPARTWDHDPLSRPRFDRPIDTFT